MTARYFIFHDLQHGPLAMARGSGAEKIANRDDRLPVLSDHLSDIALPQL